MKFQPGNKLGFQKGQSGNPGGRKPDPHGVRELAVSMAVQAVKGLHAIATDPKAPHAARVKAWNSILDRGLGRPVQEIVGAGGERLFPYTTGNDIDAGEVAKRVAFLLASGTHELEHPTPPITPKEYMQ